MSTTFYILAIIAALAMFVLGMIGCAMMQAREPSKSAREDWFRVFDLVFLAGAVWSIQTFRQNWRVRHQARHLILWSLGCLGAFLVFIALHICLEVSKI